MLLMNTTVLYVYKKKVGDDEVYVILHITATNC